MNHLSWLIYFAEVLPGLGAIFLMFGFVSVPVYVYMAAFGNSSTTYWSCDTQEHKEKWESFKKRVAGFVSVRSFIISFVVILIGILIPSKSTIYMIAASEAGETVVNSPEAKEILSDLQKLIRNKLK